MFLKRSSVAHPELEEGQDALTGGGVPAGKTPEEIRQEKIEKKATEQKKEDERDKIEQMEYFRFPNIMGWYFDGTFTKDFTLHEEYAEYFNEIEDELDAQQDLIIAETFTESAYRNFWPPVYLGGTYFRTRGIYLDLKEVKEDPPRTPPNINYEKQRGVIGVEIGETDAGLQGSENTGKFLETYGHAGHHSSRDKWYWAQTKRDFKPKEIDGDYIWCDEDRIWRERDATYRTPYDWYFDEKKGQYFIRDHTTPDLYEFDKEKNIYKKPCSGKGPSTNGMRYNDYFYDERNRKWSPITNSSGHLKMYPPGMREVLIGDRGKSGLIPDDFYYDGETGKVEQKDGDNLQEYYYDTHDKMFKKKNQPYGPGVTNLYPTDYEFDLRLGKYNPKPAKECRHIEPYDYYFDNDQGKFFRKDYLHRDKYVFDEDVQIYKLKDAKGPSANELTPEQYYWNENEREWKLIITLKDPEVLETHEPGKRKILKGDRGKSGKVPDDFYYDGTDGSFFRKDIKKLHQYWYDTIDDVWKKRGQDYGPGFFQLDPHHYYFDFDEGFWFPTATAKSILAKQMRGETKGLSDLTAYDYAFNDADEAFIKRDLQNPRMYEYNSKTGVFHVKGTKTSKNGKHPKDFFFDEVTCTWLPLEHPKGHEARDYKNGRRNNRNGPRGKSGKIPDDYYFSFATSKFLEKDPNDAEAVYEYLPHLGVWHNSKEIGQPNPKSPAITEYYFDKEEGKYIEKQKLEYGEIYLNPNTNLWMQRWRCPNDYYWEQKQNKYVRKPAIMIQKSKNKGAASSSAAALAQAKREEEAAAEEKKRRERDYERPWLHNYLTLAADEIRFEQELLKQTKSRDKGGSKKKGPPPKYHGKPGERANSVTSLNGSPNTKSSLFPPTEDASKDGLDVSRSETDISKEQSKKGSQKGSSKKRKKARVQIE